MEELLLTVSEAGKATKVGRSKAYEFATNGTWPVVRIGRSIRIPADGLRAWVEAQQSDCDQEGRQVQGQ